MSDISDMEKVEIYYNSSLGSDCTSATALQIKKIKSESYPFDWLISDIPDIIDCLETDFKHFLYPNENKNQSRHIRHRHPYYNNIYSMHYPMNNSNYEYYSRCIERFRNILKKDENKLFLIINRNKNYDYNQIKENINKLKNTLKKYTTNFYIFCVNHTIKKNQESESPVVSERTTVFPPIWDTLSSRHKHRWLKENNLIPPKLQLIYKTEIDENIIYLQCNTTKELCKHELANQVMSQLDKYFEFK